MYCEKMTQWMYSKFQGGADFLILERTSTFSLAKFTFLNQINLRSLFLASEYFHLHLMQVNLSLILLGGLPAGLWG